MWAYQNLIETIMQKTLWWWVGFLLLVTIIFTYNIPQSDKIMEKEDNEIIPKRELSNRFTLDENNVLHLRSRDLDETDVSSIVTMLQQIKHDDKGIESISFSYNPRIGDSWITRIMQSMPASVKEIGCVGCGINDVWGLEILEWMKRSSNLQMICIEQNSFSDDLKQQFNIFKKQNPHIMVIF